MAGPLLTLRPVQADDAEAYVRMRCDPAMMAELGGPQPRADVLRKVALDVQRAESGVDWILMVVQAGSQEVAGTVVLWHNTEHGEAFTEIGWMILTEYQGRGLAKAAVLTVLETARQDGRWGAVHAFPGITNGPSNGICRSIGFTLLGQETIEFAGRPFAANHWCIDPEDL